ncbi:MAG: serine hydrolase [Cyanobacteriota bacterium]
MINELISKIKGDIGIYAENILSKKKITLNEKKIFPSASVIKIFILYNLFQNIFNKKIDINSKLFFEEKNLIPDSPYFETLEIKSGEVSLYNVLHSMITVSDNTSTNLLIELLGFDNINNSIKELDLKNTKLQRKMYDFESREKGIDNFTTPEDIALFLKKLTNNRIITKKEIEIFDIFNIATKNYISYAILKILSEQKDLEKIPSGFTNNNYLIAVKAGELPNIRNDAGIIITDDNNYLISIFTENVEDEIYTDKIIGEISSFLVHNYL